MLLLGIFFVALALFWGQALGFDFFRSDVKSYWQVGLDWREPFHVYHVQGYPLLIAMARGVTLNQIPPVTLMMSITLAAFLISLVLLYRTLRHIDVNSTNVVLGVVLFSIWPFVGLVFAVCAIADALALAMVVAGFYLFLRSRLVAAGPLRPHADRPRCNVAICRRNFRYVCSPLSSKPILAASTGSLPE